VGLLRGRGKEGEAVGRRNGTRPSGTGINHQGGDKKLWVNPGNEKYARVRCLLRVPGQNTSHRWPHRQIATTRLRRRALPRLFPSTQTPVPSPSKSFDRSGAPSPVFERQHHTSAQAPRMPRPECPAENTVAVEESSFFNADGINWTPHTIGWSVAGGCAVLVCLAYADQRPGHPH